MGPYLLESRIGEGGMGVVFRARDTRLDRIVALKILATERAIGDESKRRFLQEAKAASALNHPNIVTIYDVGSEGGVEYLAMEFVEGKTVDQLIPTGGIRIGELLGYAVQVADALTKAHEAGIVHRDLKPSNVMVSTGGLVKVLDFGLAKFTRVAAPNADATQTLALTNEGAVIGTAYYMSPEQAEGKSVDPRSDIFSFGVMLYEMAAGQRPFTGDSQVAVLAAILREDPKPLLALRAEIPPEVARIVARCMRKDPARRWQHMADLKVALQELKEELQSGTLLTAHASTQAPVRTNRAWLWPALAAGLAVIGLLSWYIANPTKPVQDTALRPIPFTSYAGLEDSPSFSPDGNQVAFSWNGEKEDNTDIYVKLIGPGSPLRLTTDPADDTSPRWSPDGRSVAFVRQEASVDEKFSVFVVPVLGGPERRVGNFSNHGGGWAINLPSLCWTNDSKALIVSAAPARGAPNRLVLVPLDGGQNRVLTDPKQSVYGDTRPVLSDDGRKLAFIREGDSVFGLFIQMLSAAKTPEGAPAEIPLPERLVTGLDWMPGGRELVFVNGLTNSSTLFRVAASAGATPQLLNGIGPGAFSPAVSREGHHLAYAAGTVDSNIWAVDLNSKTSSLQRGLSSSFSDPFPQFSPDGKRVAFYSYRSGAAQIWVANRDGSQVQQLTSMGGTVNASPRWSPDGQQIAFDSNIGGEFQVYVMALDEGQPRLVTSEKPAWGANWSHDGRWIYYASSRSGAY
jgi:serine/threonine protein kinase